jgi:hypothetical protein
MSVVGVAHVLACERMAQALVAGFAACETNGNPLTENQRADMIASALLTFDGLESEIQEVAELDSLLGEIGRQ